MNNTNDAVIFSPGGKSITGVVALGVNTPPRRFVTW